MTSTKRTASDAARELNESDVLRVFEFSASITVSARNEDEAREMAEDVAEVARHSADFSILLEDAPPVELDDMGFEVDA